MNCFLFCNCYPLTCWWILRVIWLYIPFSLLQFSYTLLVFGCEVQCTPHSHEYNLFSLTPFFCCDVYLLLSFAVINHPLVSCKIWQDWCFLELITYLLPWLCWKFGTHLFNLAVLSWHLQRFRLEVLVTLPCIEGANLSILLKDLVLFLMHLPSNNVWLIFALILLLLFLLSSLPTSQIR